MATPLSRYATPPSDNRTVSTQFDTLFSWDYDQRGNGLRKLYAESKRKQWDAHTRIDWSRGLDAENPAQLPDSSIPIFASDVFRRLTQPELGTLRRHFQGWYLSQFLHGEQAALLGAAKIVQQLPTTHAKLYGATQVVDEARHVEVFSRLLAEKFEILYALSPALQRLLADLLADRRWDVTLLGTQLLVEGFASAAYAQIRDQSESQLIGAATAYVMQDEAHHAAFARYLLRAAYAGLSDAERDEREEIAVEACAILRDRFVAPELWEAVQLPVAECVAYVSEAGLMRAYRAQLFSRIVPAMKEIGLWGLRIRKAFRDLGVMGFSDLDSTTLAAADERAAHQYDLRRFEEESRVPLDALVPNDE